MSAPRTRRTIRVFIGSPGDLTEERAIFPKVLAELNEVKAHAIGYHLEPIGWEDTLPGVGRPQELINADLATCDLAVLLLWKRWGTPTGSHSSGFAEEFHLCMNQEKQVMVYLKDIAPEYRGDPGPQLAQVLEFRRSLEEQQQLLFHRFVDPEAFAALLRRHLARWLDQKESGISDDGRIVHPGAWLRQIANDEDMSRELVEQVINTASARQQISVILSDEARARFLNGALERAEYLLQVAIDTFPGAWAIHAYQQVLVFSGRLPEAKKLAADLQRAADATQDRQAQVFACEAAGAVADAEGRLDDAEAAYQKALELTASPGYEDARINALMHLGCIYRDRGDWKRGLEYLQDCLDLLKDYPDHEATATALNHAVAIHLNLGAYGSAKGLAEEALVLAQAQGAPRQIALAQMNLATVAGFQGEPEKASRFFRAAGATARESGDQGLEALMASYEGGSYLQSGKYELATRTLEDALALHRKNSRFELVTTTLYNLGQAYLKMARWTEAAKALEEAVSGFKRLGRPDKLGPAEELLKFARSEGTGPPPFTD